MKNFGVISSLLCLAVLLPLFVPSMGQMKYCQAPDIPRDGACNGGGRSCFEIVPGHFPASEMPTDIRCVDVGPNQSKCTCKILC